ncbi:MAG: VIT1/CCC1 transporter family protein [Asticcacaulis sp.]|uniref:VIT1/CCC1 transporter family protein n=1 Tax=Asticcacaulis sp. TaxID=1872648 RepID=UPI003F7CB498
MNRHRHKETHVIERIGWLRAAVLGANDGIVSTAALLVGVAATSASKGQLLITGVAALTAGALSMAAGEYVSVSSQSDTENAELARERQELRDDPEAELVELQGIYQARGLSAELAAQVARQLTDHDALDAHARDELGISEITTARPVQAAFASALSFSAGAILPIIVLWFSPRALGLWTVSVSSLIFLAALGALGAWAGGSKMLRPVIRVTFWGALALVVTAGVGKLFGAVG